MVSWALSDGWRLVVGCWSGDLHVRMASVAGGRGRPDGYLCLCWPGAGSPSSSPFPLPCYDRTSWHDTTPRVVGEEEEPELLQVQSGRPGKAVGPIRGEAEPHRPQIAVRAPLHQPGRTRPVDQLDRAVMAHQQVASHLPDGRAGWVWMAADGKQQLVLGWSHARHGGLVGAPAQEPVQPGAEVEQPLVGSSLQRHHPTLSCDETWRRRHCPLALTRIRGPPPRARAGIPKPVVPATKGVVR